MRNLFPKTKHDKIDIYQNISYRNMISFHNQKSGCHVPIQITKHKRLHYKSFNKYIHMQTCKQKQLDDSPILSSCATSCNTNQLSGSGLGAW